jgi:hypothetical protein
MGTANWKPSLGITTFLVATVGCGPKSGKTGAAEALSPKETQSLAKEACIYGFTMVDHYNIDVCRLAIPE